MFTQISWSTYLTTVLLLVVGYYLFIVFRYYRKDVVKIFASRKNTADENLSMDIQTPMLQSFSIQVRAFLFEAIRNNLNKDDIMGSIRMLIGKYPGVKDMTFRNSIEHLIIEESAASIHLSEQDLRELWY
jgi:hypothetical protein